MDLNQSEARKEKTTLLEKNRKKIIAAGLTFGIGIAALTGCAPSSEAAPKPSTSTSAEATETPTATPETEAPVESIEIPAGLNSEELAVLVMEDRLTGWANAGADVSIFDRAYEENITMDILSVNIVSENAPKYYDALLVDDWESSENLSYMVKLFTAQNTGILRNYAATAHYGDDPNTEGYRTWFTVDNVEEISTDGNTRSLEVSTTYHDNSDKNRAEKFVGNENETWAITLISDGTNEKISDMEIVHR